MKGCFGSSTFRRFIKGLKKANFKDGLGGKTVTPKRPSVIKRTGLAATAVLTLTLVAFICFELFPPFVAERVFAALAAWDMGTAGDYTYNDAKISFSGGVAELKSGYTAGTDWLNQEGSTDWTYRRSITIDNSGSGSELSGYQAEIEFNTAELITASKLQSSCQDIRFSDSDGATLLSYWLESGCDTATTKVWVQGPTVAAGQTKIIYLYYGNNAAAAGSGDPSSISGRQLWLKSDTGVYTDGAADFSSANKEYLNISSNSTLQAGDIDFEIGGWVRFASVATEQGIAGKYSINGNAREYLLYLNTSGQISFLVSNDGTAVAAAADTGTTISADTWYFVRGYHDPVENKIYVQVNGGTKYSANHSTGISAGSTALALGGFYDSTGAVNSFLNGRLDSVYVRKQISTDAEITALYNSGNGRIYADLATTAALSDFDTNLVSWWDMDAATGATQTDSHGDNDLTPSAAYLITGNTLNGNLETRATNGGTKTGAAIVNVARSSNVATIEATGHGLASTNVASIVGVTTAGFNASSVTVTRVDDDHFTYANTGADVGETADATGRVTTDVFASVNDISDAAGSIISLETSDVHGGSNALKMTVNAANGNVYFQWSSVVTAGRGYSYSFWGKADAEVAVYIFQGWMGGSYGTKTLTTGWAEYTGTFTGVAGGTAFGINRGTANNRVHIFDDFTLKSNGPILAAGIARGVAVDGDDISLTDDQSGNDKDFTQTTATTRPLLDSDGINSLPAHYFDGVDDSMSNANDLIGTGDVTVYAVIKPAGYGGGNLGRIIDNVTFSIAVDANDSGRLSCATAVSGTDSINADTVYVIGVTKTSAGVVNFYINGALSGTADQAIANPASGSPTYWGNRAAGDRAFNGRMTEPLIFNSILSESQRQVLDRYFSAKYNAGLTSNLPGVGAEESTLYPTDNPTVTLSSYQGYSSVSAFSAALGDGSTGTIKFQISNNGNSGTPTWYWWDGANWSATVAGYSESNTAADIQTNLAAFSLLGTGSKYFKWRAFFHSTGAEQPRLDAVSLTYLWDLVAPPNPSSVTALNQSDGSVPLTSSNWYNYPTPYFSWTAPTDTANTGEGETVSGTAGYYIYFGTSASADPYTAGSYQTATNYTVSGLTDGQTYYLRFVTKDNAGNRAAAGTLFTYKYDLTVPANPAFISVSPAGYSSANNYTFIWPSSGASAAADPGAPTTGSDLAGYQYKTGAVSGSYTDWSSTITETQVALSSAAYQEGANVFYLRTVDNAGNASAAISSTFYYAGSSPSAPTSLTASPETSSLSNSITNNFSFSWDLPASYNGSIKQYRYSINVLPTNANTTISALASLDAGPYATQQGKNTFYVVAEDEAGNINYNVYASVDFYAVTPAPGMPTALSAVDGSNRDLLQYKVFLTWNEPDNKGTGFAGYEIYRSTDNTNFSSIGITNGTTFADTGLESTLYYYYVKSKDNAGQYSSSSTTVLLTPTGKYTTPPVLDGTPSVVSKAFSADIAWETDREGSSFIEYGINAMAIGKTKGGETVGNLDQVKRHQVSLKGLNPDTVYYYQAVWVDQDGNTGKSAVMSFLTKNRPKITDVKISAISLSSAIISWSSTTIADSVIRYGKSTGYGQTVSETSGSQTTNHVLQLSDLDHSSAYHFQISATDTDGNQLVSDDYSFDTLTKPAISDLRFESVKDAATSSLRFTWNTNVPATSIVYYQANDETAISQSIADYVINHDITVRGLLDQTKYTLWAKSVDQYGNEAISDMNTFTTPDDSRPPKVSNLTIEIKSSGFGSTQKAQIVATWETDEPATSQLEYSPGISGSEYSFKSKEDTALSTSHVVIASELEPSKIYHLRAVSRDRSGNTGTSEDTTVITGKVQRSVVDLIVDSLQRSLGWMFGMFGSK